MSYNYTGSGFLDYDDPVGAESSTSSPALLNQLLTAHGAEASQVDELLNTQRSFSLGSPYPPCSKPFSELRRVHFRDFRGNGHHVDCFVLVKLVSDALPLVVDKAAVVVDERDAPKRMSFFGQEHNVDPGKTFTRGMVAAIKEPRTRVVGHQTELRVDHPSNMTWLEPDHEWYPEKWRDPNERHHTAEEWKQMGEDASRGELWVESTKCFTHAFERLRSNVDVSMNVDVNMNADVNMSDDPHILALHLHYHRALAYFKLGRHHLAIEDLTVCRTEQPDSFIVALKMAKSLYSIGRYQRAKQVLEGAVPADWVEKAQFNYLHKRILARLKECNHGSFNFKTLAKAVNLESFDVDAADYTVPITLIGDHENPDGLCANQQIPAGGLVLCEKALSMFLSSETGNCEAPLVEMDVTTGPRVAPAALLQDVIQKCLHDTIYHEAILKLRYKHYNRSGNENKIVDGMVVVDTFLICRILQYNELGADLNTVASAVSLDDMVKAPLKFQGQPGRGLWSTIFHVKHSCLPNTVRSHLGNMVVVRALRDIQAGEQITMQYMPVSANRQVQLDHFKLWNLKCECRYCLLRKTVAAADRNAEIEHLAAFNTVHADIKLRINNNLDCRESTTLAARTLRHARTSFDRGFGDVLSGALQRPYLRLAFSSRRAAARATSAALAAIQHATASATEINAELTRLTDVIRDHNAFALSFAEAALEVMGYHLKLDDTPLEHTMRVSRTCARPGSDAVDAFMLAAAAHAKLGRAGVAGTLAKQARLAFKIAYGHAGTMEQVFSKECVLLGNAVAEFCGEDRRG